MGKVKPVYVVVGTVAALVLAGVVIFTTSTQPQQTINPHPEKIPAKGASRGDKG
ncbi:MAG TPA: hypothetical protein VG944_22235 [Fimbriimonas sp.]|nr:hypothetical protein [Fimbriimonas sp.]